MPSEMVAESESRFDNKLSTWLGENDTESRNSWVQLVKVGTESDGFGTQDLESEFRHSAFSHPFHMLKLLAYVKAAIMFDLLVLLSVHHQILLPKCPRDEDPHLCPLESCIA